MSYDFFDDEVCELLSTHDLLHERREGTPIKDGLTYWRGRYGPQVVFQITVGDHTYRLTLRKGEGFSEYVKEVE